MTYAMQFKACSIAACCKPYYSRGYCRSHYYRFSRYGHPLAGGTPIGEPLRFIHEVAVYYVGDECLLWPYGKSDGGYGQVYVDGHLIGAHRYICELVHGAPPTPDHDAAHSCGKGHEACIAPGHLDWKTRAENMADKLVHDTHQRGQRNGNAKLTEAEAREIFSLKGIETLSNLTERFGVSRRSVSNIHNGLCWNWLSASTEGNSA